MAQDFLTDEQMQAATPDPSDMDPQSAAAMPGMRKIVSAAVDDTKNAPGDDSIQPDYNSPIEAIGFAAPKMAMSATDALANGLSHTDFGKIVGNEIGTLGRQKTQDYAGNLLEQGQGSPAKPGALQRIAKAVGLPEDAKAHEMIDLAAQKLKEGHPDLKQSDLVLLRQKANGTHKGSLSTTVDDTRKKSYAEGGEVESPDFIPDSQFNQKQESQLTVNSAPKQTNSPDFIPDDQFHSDTEQYETPGQQVLTGLEGAARGIAGPIAPITEQVLNKQLFNQDPEDTNKHIRAREEANPMISKVSEGAALLGSMYFGVGEAGLIAKAGNALEKGVQGASLASRVGSSAAKAAVENMLFQGSDEASKMIMQDPSASTQTALAHIGLAGLLGGSLGGALEVGHAAFKAPIGKLGQIIEDFKGRMAEHTEGGDPATSLQQELTDHYSNIKQVADDVYGPTGIKAQDIEKSMPEMSEAIRNSSQENSTKVSDVIGKMTEDSYRYPRRLTGKLAEDLRNYNEVLEKANSPSEIFNATQDLKQQVQSYAKYDKFVKPTDEAYDFVREAKKIAFDLRNQLEDKTIWGKAAERQQAINKAFTEFNPALKDFEKKFTTEISGEKTIDPGKVQSYINSVDKVSGSVKKEMLANFLEASEKYKHVIDKSHINLGMESPIVNSPLNVAYSTLQKKTTGSKLADIFINKGLSDAGGKTMGAAVGAAASHGLGISHEIGALIGAHALGPFFSSVLPALAKPLMSIASHPEAFKEASEYGASVTKGERLLNKGIRNVFTDDKDVIPPNQMPTDKDTSKLDKILNGLRVNTNAIFNIGGMTGHYLPDHVAPMAGMAQNAVQFLNSQRPQTTPDMPLDSHIKAAPYQANDYNRLLKLAQQPLMALDMMKKGTLNHHDVQAIQTMYPQLYGKMVQKLTAEIVNHKDKGKLIPYKTRMGLSLFVGQPLDSTMSQPSILATQIGKSSARPPQENSQLPQKPPSGSSTKELTKAPAANRTPSQARQYNQQTKD